MKKLLLALFAGLMVSSVFATTYDLTVGGTNGYPDFYGRKVYTITRTLDLAVNQSTAYGADTIKFINIPPTSVVLGVTYAVPVAVTNTPVTMNVGDVGSATRYGSSVNITTTVAETLYATPNFKSTYDYLRVTFSAAPGNTGKIVLKLLMLDLNSYQGD